MNQPPLQTGSQEAARSVWVHPLLRVFGWAVALVLFLWFFDALKLILLTFLAAAALAAALRPLLHYIPGPRWIPPVLVGLIPVIIVGGAIVSIGWLLSRHISEELRQLPKSREEVNIVLARWSDRLDLDQDLTLDQLTDQLRRFFLGEGSGIISTAANTVTGLLLVVLLVFFGSIYLLSEHKGRLYHGVLSALPERRRPQFRAALSDLQPQLRWWLIGVTISMSVVGIAAYIGYSLVGLQLAAPLALISGFAELVPTLGPAFAFLVALLFAAAQGTEQVIGVIIAYLVIQTLESYVLLPLVMKQAVHIPPVVTLFSVVLWWQIFGVGGLLLAIPIDLVIWNALYHFMIQPREQAHAPT